MSLPKLEGSEKQVAWAEKLRENLFKLVEKNKDLPEHPTLRKRYGDIYKVFAEEIKKETSAKFFIDNRDEGFFNVMERYLKEKNILKIVEVTDARDEKWLIKFLGEYPQGQIQYSPKEWANWKPIEWEVFCEKAGIDVEMFKTEQKHS